MFALRIIEYIGGYIEYVYVPPLITDWQRLTAERSVAHVRMATQARIAGDLKALEKNVQITERQIDDLFCTMSEQEKMLRTLQDSPTDIERKKNIMATYCVHSATAKKLRTFVHILTRVSSELIVRQAVLHTAKNTVSLKSSKSYMNEFEMAANTLLDSESQMDEISRLMYGDEMEEPDWEKMANSFIEQMGSYHIPQGYTSTIDPIKFSSQ